jgi:hypothetical protein
VFLLLEQNKSSAQYLFFLPFSFLNPAGSDVIAMTFEQARPQNAD